MRVYIAGPMTGLPEYNFPAFNAAAAAWREAGWEVLNPAESFEGRTDLPYEEYVDHDIDLLVTCDAIAVLPGWNGANARGSVWERAIARKLLRIAVYDASSPVAAENVVPKQKESALQEAQRLVHGNRGADYGHPIDDYSATGRIWGATLERWLRSIGFPLPPEGFPDVDPRVACLMMGGVKISREAGKHKRDNTVDLAGYAECAQMVAERQGK